MKKLLITISIIIIGLFFFDGLFSFFIQENRNIKLSNAMKGNMDYDILFHGPCEPLFTINPSKIDSLIGTKSYNYALRHTDFADNYLHLYLYLKAMTTLSLLQWNRKPNPFFQLIIDKPFLILTSEGKSVFPLQLIQSSKSMV